MITGPEAYIFQISDALDLIFKNDKGNWKVVKNNITKITLRGCSEMDVFNNRYMTNDNENESLEWIASEVVHDAWHGELFENKQPYRAKKLKENVWLSKMNS